MVASSKNKGSKLPNFVPIKKYYLGIRFGQLFHVVFCRNTRSSLSLIDYQHRYYVLVTVTVKLALLTVLPLLIASQMYCPLLVGGVCLRGVKERVSDVSPVRGGPLINH